MKKIGHILRGWGKALGVVPTTSAEKKLSELRLKICGICAESKPKQFLVWMNDDAHYEFSLMCDKCGCPCLEKSLVVDETCPLKKW